MTTGYTIGVASGEVTTLSRFLEICVRGSEAFAHMREDSGDAPLRLPTGTDSLTPALADLEGILRTFRLIEETGGAAAAHAHALARAEKHRREAVEVNSRTAHMRAQVQAWEPPEDMVPTKDFMLKQLAMTGEKTLYHDRLVDALRNTTPEAWLAVRIKDAQGELDRLKAVQRVAEQRLVRMRERAQAVIEEVHRLRLIERAVDGEPVDG